MNNENKIDTLMHSITFRLLVPTYVHGEYEPEAVAIVNHDLNDSVNLWHSMFPTETSEFTIITPLEYDVYKKHFPTLEKDERGVRCLCPVEEHLRYGIQSPPNPYIKMLFPDKELFKDYIRDDAIHIMAAQFRPINKDDRKKFEMDNKEVYPIGSMNIWVDIPHLKLEFMVSRLICIDIATNSYAFTKVIHIDNQFVYTCLMEMELPYRLDCYSADFINLIYTTFKNIGPISALITEIWESFQYMMLNPDLKTCFFSEEGPFIHPYEKHIRSGVDLRRIRKNVKYIHVDIAKHHDVMADREKRKYTKPTHQVPYKGYTYKKNGKDVYVGPGVKYKNNPPVEEPIERVV